MLANQGSYVWPMGHSHMVDLVQCGYVTQHIPGFSAVYGRVRPLCTCNYY